jgi:hypothetical protein
VEKWTLSVVTIDTKGAHAVPLEVVVDKAHHAGQAPTRRLLLVRVLVLLAGGVLLVLLSSRPAGAAERQRPGLLDPVGGTLTAATEPVGSLARGAVGTVSSTGGPTAGVARRSVATLRRPAARPAVGPTTPARAVRAIRRGAPAATSPDRRTAPPTQRIARPQRHAGSPTDGLAGPLRRALAPVSGPLAGSLAPAGGALTPAGGALAPVTAQLGGTLAPVTDPLGEALAPVAETLDPLVGPLGRRVGGVLPGGLLPVGLPVPGGLLTPPTAPPTSRAGPVADLLTDPASAGPALIVPPPAAGEGPAAGRSGGHRGGPNGIASLALEAASSLPAPAGLPVGQGAISSSPAAGIGLAALAGALLLFGLRRHARALAERSGTLSRSYLPLVAPA